MCSTSLNRHTSLKAAIHPSENLGLLLPATEFQLLQLILEFMGLFQHGCTHVFSCLLSSQSFKLSVNYSSLLTLPGGKVMFAAEQNRTILSTSMLRDKVVRRPTT